MNSEITWGIITLSRINALNECRIVTMFIFFANIAQVY